MPESNHDCFFCNEPLGEVSQTVTAQYCGEIKTARICARCHLSKPLREVLATMFGLSPTEVMGLGYSKQTMFRINTPASRRQEARAS